MRLKVNALLPCVTFFRAGRGGMGVTALFMQVSLFLWPTAVRMAREYSESHAVARMLTTLSETYTAVQPVPRKRFKPAAGVIAPGAAETLRQVA